MPSSPITVLYFGPEDAVLRTLASRDDVQVMWARSAKEAHAALSTRTPRLCVVTAKDAEDVLDAAGGARVPVLVPARGDEAREAQSGVTEIGFDLHHHVLMTIANLAGLAYAACPRAPRAQPTPTVDLPIEAPDVEPGALMACLEGDRRRAPWWLAEIIDSLTPSEIAAARGAGPAWAARSLEVRLWVCGLRIHAGLQNLTRTHFELVREICRTLGEQPDPLSDDEIADLTICRAAILGGLFGTETAEADAPWEQDAAVERVRAKAHMLIEDGAVRAAAKLLADAELLDDAIHLYRNVIGAPAEAAPLAAKRYGLEAAAELYELGGRYEPAAAIWSRLARRADKPERYLSRIAMIAPEALPELQQQLAEKTS